MVNLIKDAARKFMPKSLRHIYRVLITPVELNAILKFLLSGDRNHGLRTRWRLLVKFMRISMNIRCAHAHSDVLPFISEILSIPHDVSGCIVEAGCYVGGSTAKYSLAARLAGRQLLVFDSFEGIPPHHENHCKNNFGIPVSFPQGNYRGDLETVRENVSRYGDLESCVFYKGLFNEIMPGFSMTIAIGYLDVDLASSTKTCLQHLYPHLRPGGNLYSHDGHIPLVLEVFKDEKFWEESLAYAKPSIAGLGKSKVLKITKPMNSCVDYL